MHDQQLKHTVGEIFEFVRREASTVMSHVKVDVERVHVRVRVRVPRGPVDGRLCDRRMSWVTRRPPVTSTGIRYAKRETSEIAKMLS